MHRKDYASRSSTEEVSLIWKAVRHQQDQTVEQNQLMGASLISSLSAVRPVTRFIEPDMFDGTSSRPERRLEFCEYAAGRDTCNADEY
ncbi:hypothetical protein HPB50_016804 [Hyalomma asiaticum]|uniref:Uncharacterized protein n=1 Tax=Hyalomma asiaticum TaxID=266040 RepID=A0ACB7SF79_HYAAI|nr:hypothetical protein HPB50_016804 [Hyalomma asiaticum]